MRVVLLDAPGIGCLVTFAGGKTIGLAATIVDAAAGETEVDVGVLGEGRAVASSPRATERAMRRRELKLTILIEVMVRFWIFGLFGVRS
jgi:hypothetical protein